MPAIFEGHNHQRIFREATFGPVVSVTSFDGFEDAIAIANDSAYGLGAGVWTRSTRRAFNADPSQWVLFAMAGRGGGGNSCHETEDARANDSVLTTLRPRE
jgi:hypothetical protein